MQKLINKFREKMYEHAIKEFPKEAGFAIKNGKLIILKNKSDNPENFFQVEDPKLVDKASIVIHSHTVDMPYPSLDDIAWARANALPCGVFAISNYQYENTLSCSDIVVFNNDDYDVNLYNRPTFIPNVFDCQTLVLSYFKQKKGLILTPCPVNNPLDLSNKDILLQNLNRYTEFIEVPPEKAKQGDMIVFKIKATYPNHLGIYLGKNQLLHHLYGKPACKESITPYLPFIVKVLRLK